MIGRRTFIKLVAGGLVVSQFPGALLDGWGQTTPLPGDEIEPKRRVFDFDDPFEVCLRFQLLSVDGTGLQAIQHQSAGSPWFEPLPCAQGDAQLASVLVAIKNLAKSGSVADNLYLFAQGSSENLPRVIELAKAANSIGAFTVALIAETDDTDIAQWAVACAEVGTANLSLISPQALGPEAAILAPHLAEQPLELAYLAALRAHSDLIWNTGLIGIDYADYKTVVGGKGTGRLGIGGAAGARRGQLATQMALGGLQMQGIDPTEVRGYWVTIFAGNDCTMEDFDDVIYVLNAAVDEEADVIVGIFLGEEFAEKVTVTVLAG